MTLNDGQTKSIYKPVNITVIKSPVEIEYDLTNPFNVNYNPYEIVIDTSWLFCESNGEYLGDENDFDFSCNKLYYKNTPDKSVQYSSGFCCSCPISTIFFGTSSSNIRGSCGIFSPSRTAHCMRYHPTWYTGYKLGKSKAKYNITLTIETMNSSGETTKSSVSLNESYLTYSDKDLILRATITNPNVQVEGIDTLQGQTFLKPTTGQSNTSSNWLKVESSMISQNGSECNKIGVSMETFHNQHDKCQVSKNSCLKNQVHNLIEQDKQRKSSGKSFKYILNSEYTGAVSIKNEQGNDYSHYLKKKFDGKHMTEI